MARFKEVFNMILNIREHIRNNGSTMFKKAVGDSTHNNRTPSVRQIIRASDDRVGLKLEAVYQILRPHAIKARKKRGSNRTDAVDINELLNVYRNLVMNKKQLRRQVGQALSKI